MAPFFNERQFKIKFQEQVLAFLLRKYERSQAFLSGRPSRQRPQFTMKKSPFQKDYYDEMDFMKRVWMHDVLQELEREELVSLSWMRFQEGSELEKVYLNVDALEKVYLLAGIEPKHKKMERMRETLQPLEFHPWEWVRQWWQETDLKLAKRKSGGLDLDDLSGYKDLVKVLSKLPNIDDTGKSKRLLSQELFRDTKHFERNVQKRFLSLLKKYSPIEFETDEEYLDSVGIVENPKNVYVSGWLECQLRGETVSTKGFLGSIGLSAWTVKEMEICSIYCKRIITIENLTSYHQWTQQRAGKQELVIYTGGFPHRTLQMFLAKLANYLKSNCPNMPVYHWGDIDVGGVRIFEFIKTNFFQKTEPILMDASTFMKYKDKALPIDDGYVLKVRVMLESQRFSSWHEVLQLLEQYRLRIEQESIDEIPSNFSG